MSNPLEKLILTKRGEKMSIIIRGNIKIKILTPQIYPRTLAKIMGVTERHIRNLYNNGKIVAYRAGIRRGIRFETESVIDYLISKSNINSKNRSLLKLLNILVFYKIIRVRMQ